MEQNTGEPSARHPRKCTARSKRSKQLCKRWAMKAQTVCTMHGGKAPRALAKAHAAMEVVPPHAVLGQWPDHSKHVLCFSRV